MANAMVGAASLDFVENWAEEDEILTAARAKGTALGCMPIGPAGGATLRFLAAALNAKAVVEIGTGAGTSSLWLMRGMRPDGVLTTVDTEPEHQKAARETLTQAGISPHRFRMINGSAAEVLPRLTDGAYDLVFVDADKIANADYLEQARRLLRVGGVVAFDNTLRGDKVADSSVHDDATVVTRELLNSIREDPQLTATLLPVGDGLLAAVRG